MNGRAVTYEVSGGAVRICKGSGESIVISRDNILMAVENVKAQRGFYKTEEAYKCQLKIYEGALAFFDDNMK